LKIQGIGKQNIEKSDYVPLLHEDKKLNAFALPRIDLAG
jgi:hypothetical protein